MPKYPLIRKPGRLPPPQYQMTSNYQLRISPSGIVGGGLGVYAQEVIPESVIIGEYTGLRVGISTGSDYYFHISDELGGICALDYPRCVLAMINDSRGSSYSDNCEWVVIGDRVYMESSRSIQSGEELFVHYGSRYFLS